MTSFLLLISFLLHIITLLAIYFIYKQLSITNNNSDQESSKEIVELLELYVQEIKDENKRLQQQLDGYNSNKPIQTEDNEEKQPNPKNEEDFLPVIDEQVQDEVEASLQSRILQLHDRGLTVDEIARNLNCGHTEVELTIKLYKNND